MAAIQWKTRGRAHKLGDNVPHDGGVITFDFITSRVVDPAKIVPRLFEEVDPTLKDRLKQGDFIVAGKNFFAGKAHNNGMIGMKALGLRVLCESMPYRSLRSALGVPLPCLTNCVGIPQFVNDGDELEVDFISGEVKNLTQNTVAHYPGLPKDLQDTIELGGMKGMLAKYLTDHPDLAKEPERRGILSEA